MTTELISVTNALTDEQKRRWEKLMMSPVGEMRVGDQIEFTLGHLVASFAVTKEAARVLNEVLAVSLSRTFWADLAVEDYCQSAKHPRNSSGWRRGLVGSAGFNYRPLELRENELEEAARRGGIWTLDSWS